MLPLAPLALTEPLAARRTTRLPEPDLVIRVPLSRSTSTSPEPVLATASPATSPMRMSPEPTVERRGPARLVDADVARAGAHHECLADVAGRDGAGAGLELGAAGDVPDLHLAGAGGRSRPPRRCRWRVMSADSAFTSSTLPVGQVIAIATEGCGRNSPPRWRGRSTTIALRRCSTVASATASSPAAFSGVSSTVVRWVSSAVTVTWPAPQRTTSVVGLGCLEGVHGCSCSSSGSGGGTAVS